jgi:hypothetical protein
MRISDCVWVMDGSETAGRNAYAKHRRRLTSISYPFANGSLVVSLTLNL